MKISLLKENKKNPRKISEKVFENLKKSIKRDPKFMEIRPIVIDENMVILGGNQRFKAICSLGIEDVPDEWIKKVSELSEAQKKRFILLDNSPDSISGEWDFGMLEEEFLDEMKILDFEIEKEEAYEKQEEDDEVYSANLRSPIYEMKGEKPSVNDLFCDSKYMELVKKVKSSSLPKEIENFLILSATRHIRFDYSKIAEFYAHSEKDIQELFEDSALVVIDFDKAIEDGYVLLTKELKKLAENDQV